MKFLFLNVFKILALRVFETIGEIVSKNLRSLAQKIKNIDL